MSDRSKTPLRLATFAVLLLALFGVGSAAGQLLEPAAPGGDEEATEMEGQADAGHNEEEDDMGTHTEMAAAETELAPGTARTDSGFTLELGDTVVPAGVERPLRFEILDADGRPVTDFEVEHERRMHVIVARDDLTGFQHVHPEMSAGGEWSVPLRLDEPGAYKVFADFHADGKSVTLSDSLLVPGDAHSHELPPAEPNAVSDGGFDVELSSSDAEAGGEAELEFTVTRNGEPVAIESYLGADGHLVALREDDLAYLHVHPLSDISGSEATGEPIAFAATFPTAGSYRLFLQFKVDGRVETVAFTEVVR
jgi:hypothetical protein